MSSEFIDQDDLAVDKPTVPGGRGFLIMASFKRDTDIEAELLKHMKLFADGYCQQKGPKFLEEKSNGEDTTTKDPEYEATPDSCSDLQFGPYERMDGGRFFIGCNLANPSDYAHYMFSKMADDQNNGYEPIVPLRIMPIQAICNAMTKEVERALKPIFEKVFSGEDSIRFSINFFGRENSFRRSEYMSKDQVETMVRSLIWAINPNCIQCEKYQDYGVLLEIMDSLLFVGVVKEFHQLGRCNTYKALKGRDMKETMEDSEDDLSDDPELSQEDNIKKKIRIKRKRKAERLAEQEMSLKQSKCGDEGDNSELNA